jgi:hypothetical protein
MGIVVDIIFGTVGTLMVVTLFPGFRMNSWLESRTLQWSATLFVVYRIVLTIWEILEHRSLKTEDRQVRVAVGLRGVGLFLLGFLVGFVSGNKQDALTTQPQIAWWVMLTVNSLAVLSSLFCIWGIAMIRSNARWLRKYLDERSAKERTPFWPL